MRKAAIAASILGLLVLLYAAAGHWLAPRFVRAALVERAQRLGFELRIEAVRTDPFAFSVALQGIELLGADGRVRGAAHSAHADVAWASLWRPAWIVQRAELRQPRVEVSGPLARGGSPQEDGSGHFEVRELTVSDGAVHFIDSSRELKLEALQLEVSGLSTQASEPARYQLAARAAGGGALSSQGSLSLAPLGASGRLAAEAMPLAWLWQEARGELHGASRFTYEAGRLRLEDVSLDVARFAYQGIELRQLKLQSPRVAIPLREPFEVSATAAAAPRGSASARGTLGLQPLRGDLRLELNDVALAQAQRWLPGDIALKIVSGSVFAKGRLRIGERPLYEGAIAVREARFEEPGTGNVLLGWSVLETDEASVRFAPFGFDLGEVVARAPAGRLIIEKDGSTNFAALMPKADRRADEPLGASVKRLRIENGTLDFADRSLDNEFAVTARELSGALTGLSTKPGNPARVQLAGRVDEYGSARIRGTVDLSAPKSLTNIRATLRNLDLAELTPYVVRFAGYRIESGRVSADLRYRVRDGRLVGQNRLTFEELALGEKVQKAGARDLPLELAVAVLADAQGRINLDIPVSGNLNDPQFDFGGLVARAIGNVVGRIVSAPFRALAGLLGKGGADLDAVQFEPGSATLTPPAEQNVALVAKALVDRPQLEVTVQGRYDPERDVAAMRLHAARRHIARRAGVDGRVAPDLSDPKVLRAAENLYLERVGNRVQMRALRESEARYGRALLEKLAASLPVEPGTAETLASARAEMVRAELFTLGVDPSRVRVAEPAAATAGEDGVPTLLSLRSDATASAGATGR